MLSSARDLVRGCSTFIFAHPGANHTIQEFAKASENMHVEDLRVLWTEDGAPRADDVIQSIGNFVQSWETMVIALELVPSETLELLRDMSRSLGLDNVIVMWSHELTDHTSSSHAVLEQAELMNSYGKSRAPPHHDLASAEVNHIFRLAVGYNIYIPSERSDALPYIAIPPYRNRLLGLLQKLGESREGPILLNFLALPFMHPHDNDIQHGHLLCSEEDDLRAPGTKCKCQPSLAVRSMDRCPESRLLSQVSISHTKYVYFWCAPLG